MRNLKPLGFYFRCKSEFDGSPIVVILTLGSDNSKTGNMAQIWILDARRDPVATSRKGKDGSICGSCPQRHSLGGKCYVAIARAPLIVYRAWKRGRYLPWDAAEVARALAGRKLRFGAYGDPAAIPLVFWEALFAVQAPEKWTGYTHAWRDMSGAREAGFRAFLMASCDTPEEYALARSRGWRTFRSRLPGLPLLPGEFACPASEEAGKRLTCADCTACHGNPHENDGASPSIILHGFKMPRAQKFAV